MKYSTHYSTVDTAPIHSGLCSLLEGWRLTRVNYSRIDFHYTFYRWTDKSLTKYITTFKLAPPRFAAGTVLYYIVLLLLLSNESDGQCVKNAIYHSITPLYSRVTRLLNYENWSLVAINAPSNAKYYFLQRPTQIQICGNCCRHEYLLETL